MKVQLKATGIELTPAIRDYAEKRALSLTKYIHEDDDEAVVSVEVGRVTKHHKSGDIFRAEVSLRISGKHYYAVSEKDDLYAAIDIVKDELTREIVSQKGKRETLLRRGGARIKSLIKRFNWKKN